jgi:hypothetical protein
MVESKISTNVHLASWLEFLPPWSTMLGEPPTVGSTDRWGQAPAAAAIGGRITSVVAHGGRIPSALTHDGRALAP